MESKIALVTGGNRGIGLAIARGLLAKGYEVIITARSLDNARQAAAKLQGNVIPIELDVSSDRSIEEALATLLQRIERLDVLINNAGIYPDEGVNIPIVDRELLNLTVLSENPRTKKEVRGVAPRTFGGKARARYLTQTRTFL